MYYILRGHEPILCESIEEWGKWFENSDKRRVAEEKHGDIRVSTVFLGLNHRYGNGPPLLFETLIFGGAHNEEMWRYTTWDEAVAGHQHACGIAFAEVER